jgi:hypothetical protein
MRKAIILFGFVLFSAGIHAQQVLLEMPEATKYPEKKWGDNHAHVIRALIGFGFNLPTEVFPASTVSTWRGGQFAFGAHYLGRMGRFMAFNIDMTFDFHAVTASAQNQIVVERVVLENLERFTWSRSSFETAPAFRIYLKAKRGAYQGRYLDLGIIGGVRLSHSWMFEGTYANGMEGSYSFNNPAEFRLQTTDGGTQIHRREPYYSGFYARLGFQNVMFPVRYVQMSGDVWFLQTGIMLSFN